MHNIVIFTGKALHLCTVRPSLLPLSQYTYSAANNSSILLDTFSLHSLSERMISLALYRKQLYTYLEEKMATVAPNLSALIGETVAARLIQKAGSLTSLAKCPASTVQILGAEKALFRALKTKGNTPKYGLIYHSSFIGRASAKNKGRISRYLSNKCAIASRIDSFIEEPTSAYGE
jgi:nucleolar protein 56